MMEFTQKGSRILIEIGCPNVRFVTCEYNLVMQMLSSHFLCGMMAAANNCH